MLVAEMNQMLYQRQKFAKYAITVPDAVAPVKAVEGIQITTAQGGNGAFREVVDCLVK